MELLGTLTTLARQHLGPLVEPEMLKGDGSDRQIYRFHKGSQSWIGVTNPNVSENRAFIFLSGQLALIGIPVPRIYAVDWKEDCYLLEDLGNQSMADLLRLWNEADPANSAAILEAYQKVLYWLPRIQFEGHQGLDYSFCCRESVLDRSVFAWDLEYFQQFFWKQYIPQYPSSDAILKELGHLIEYLEAVERQVLVVRDFQPRNIMWKEETPYFIDYQMACRGALHYDVACLLYASSSALDEQQRDTLISVYLQELQPWRLLSKAQFLQHFYHFALLRRLRSLGTYGYLSSQKSKYQFLKAIPQTIREIHDLLLRQPTLNDFSHLKALFSEWTQDCNLSQPSLFIKSLYKK